MSARMPDQLPDNAIGNAIAHRFLAWDHILHGEFEESFIEIGDAAALNQRDMWVRYYLALRNSAWPRPSTPKLPGSQTCCST